MKKQSAVYILVGIIVVLAAVLTGVLIFLRNQPPQERAVIQPIATHPAAGGRFLPVGSELPQ